jgi:hypothetical protein
VHAVQPVSANLLSEAPDGLHVQKDLGVRLGWDDEQLLIWQNRQLLADPSTPGQRVDAPLGVRLPRRRAAKSRRALGIACAAAEQGRVDAWR